MTTTSFANFNVGGTLYKVSRSLLESHPDTMLAKSASDQWLEDPESEIFIERNGATFAFVLDYMRDGKVVLPVTVSREALIAELHFYGVEVDEDCVDDSSAKKTCAMHAFGEHVQYLASMKKEKDLESLCAQVAMDCLSTYFSREWTSRNAGRKCNQFTTGDDVRKNVTNLKSFREIGGTTNEDSKKIEMTNKLLRPVGLEIIKFSDGAYYSGGYGYNVNVKVIDPAAGPAQSS